jgi:hypothetical protein
LSGFDPVAFSTTESAICEKSRFCVFARLVFAGLTLALLAMPYDAMPTGLEKSFFKLIRYRRTSRVDTKRILSIL